MSDLPLLGRDEEVKAVRSRLEGALEHGSALVLVGEPGIGKTRLLAEGERVALERGHRVLRTTGVESEAELPFAGLHQLLHPLLGGAPRLPEPQRAALLAAFGLEAGEAPDRFLIALAALGLLADATEDGPPLLLIADDAQWLDGSSWEVMTFLARRLDSEPIFLLAAWREGETPEPDLGLPELRIGGLDEVSAGALLDVRDRRLPPSVRERVMAEATGNPLALIELPVALGDAGLLDETAALPAHLPLTTRLERTFARRAAELPAPSRAILLIGAALGGGVLSELEAAAERLDVREPAVRVLAPAVDAGLVAIDATHLRFAHPVIRSAIYQAAPAVDRHAAHEAIAEVVRDDPDRSAWHRATSASGPDEGIANELAESAKRAIRRGALDVAVAALGRAADLTPEPQRRGRRLIDGAHLGLALGRRNLATGLLDRADALALGGELRWRSRFVREMTDPASGAEVHALTDGAMRVAAEAPGLAVGLLWVAAARCWREALGPEARDHVRQAAGCLSLEGDRTGLLVVRALVDPVGSGADIRHALGDSGLPGYGAGQTVFELVGPHSTGQAALQVGDFEVADALLARAEQASRRSGRVWTLMMALSARARGSVRLARFDSARSQAGEAIRLAEELRRPRYRALARAALAAEAALRGRVDDADRLSAEAEAGISPECLGDLSEVRLARGYAALARGRYGEAYGLLLGLVRPDEPAAFYRAAYPPIAELAEAAVYSGHAREVRELIDQVEADAFHVGSPLVRLDALLARALLAEDDDAAEALFATPRPPDVLARWPFGEARLRLAHGAWLRRRRHVAESRPHLRAARDVFDALGTAPWGDRARVELRASGEASGLTPSNFADVLTPQEMQIAQMVAAGLSNREIGEQLYLSHRTIGSHLYKIFPKLGISSRAQVRDRLQGPSLAQPVI